MFINLQSNYFDLIERAGTTGENGTRLSGVTHNGGRRDGKDGESEICVSFHRLTGQTGSPFGGDNPNAIMSKLCVMLAIYILSSL